MAVVLVIALSVIVIGTIVYIATKPKPLGQLLWEHAYQLKLLLGRTKTIDKCPICSSPISIEGGRVVRKEGPSK
jgi:hypothetical protein